MTKPAASEHIVAPGCSAPAQPGAAIREGRQLLPHAPGFDRHARKPGVRWHERLLEAADLVFETDATGRFAFVAPDPALGWAAAALLGQPAESLLLGDGTTGLNPFRPLAPMRNGRAWLRTGGGEAVCLSFAASPLVDESGRMLGAGGTGVDVTEDERWQMSAASAQRRLEVLDRAMWRLRQEVTAPGMIVGALSALAGAIGADAAAIVRAPGLRANPASAGGSAAGGLGTGGGLLRHQAGAFPPAALRGVLDLTGRAANGATTARLDSGEFLICPCVTRFRPPEVLALWRTGSTARRWTAEDCEVAGSAAGIVRLVLEHEAIQDELFNQSRSDPLTGLFNRRAFVEELARRVDRLEREELPGTLLIVDVDGLDRLNRCAGFEAGDEALGAVASLLRTTLRPADLLGRLGSDEFGAWLDGADDFAAAERAEALRVAGAGRLAEIACDPEPTLGLSIGIGTRWPGRGEEIEALMHRVDRVLNEVKNSDPGQWRVSRPA